MVTKNVPDVGTASFSGRNYIAVPFNGKYIYFINIFMKWQMTLQDHRSYIFYMQSVNIYIDEGEVFCIDHARLPVSMSPYNCSYN